MAWCELSFVLRRILKLEPKNRKRIYAYIEEELLLTIEFKGLDFADTVNNALFYYLHDVKKYDPEQISQKVLQLKQQVDTAAVY